MSAPSDIEIAAATTDAPRRADSVGAIARELTEAYFGTGPLAQLRRLDPRGSLTAPALHRVLARHVPEAWLSGDGFRGWALVVHCLALAAPDNLLGKARLGRVLQETGFSEMRFVNLLDATPDDMLIQLPRAVRFLVHRGGRLHGPQLADLVLTDPAAEDQYASLRRRIAGDYYRAEHDASKAEPAA